MLADSLRTAFSASTEVAGVGPGPDVSGAPASWPFAAATAEAPPDGAASLAGETRVLLGARVTCTRTTAVAVKTTAMVSATTLRR
ncbi:hypothetical protein BCD49_15415 [Pseudofrankia sp. EUN1h]|nr:hypothetical protein BCD49_15415 [Pseudofrankia sp. EUN1h]